MLKLMSILILSASFGSSAMAYIHTSNGTGISCRLFVSAIPSTNCKDQIASEVILPESINHDNSIPPYVQVQQTTKATRCFRSTRTLSFENVVADVKEGFHRELSPNGYDAGAVYTDQVIAHQEMRHGVEYYISLTADAASRDRDLASLIRLNETNIQKIKVDYDNSTKKFTIQFTTPTGPVTQTIETDFSKGVKVNNDNVSIKLNGSAVFSDDRSYEAELMCSALSG